MSRYIQATEEERRAMLDILGVESVDELYSDVPEQVLLKEFPGFPSPLGARDGAPSQGPFTEEQKCR